MFAPVLGESIIGRAQKSGAVEIHTHQLRDYALDKHRRRRYGYADEGGADRALL